MTDKRQNEVLAEIEGKTDLEWYAHDWLEITRRDENGKADRFANLPNYANDYNAVHRVLNTLDVLTLNEYEHALYDVMGRPFICQATCEQMREAIIRAVGRWEQPKEVH